MPVVAMRDLLEAGVHFGHQTRRWNPKMRRFIFTERGGIYIIDLRKEAIAVREARRLGLPVVALVDTNCDPDEADYVVPGNDDAIKACELVVRTMADALEAGKQQIRVEEFEPAAEEAPAVEEAPVVEEAPAVEQLSQGESAEETAKAEAEEVPAE